MMSGSANRSGSDVGPSQAGGSGDKGGAAEAKRGSSGALSRGEWPTRADMEHNVEVAAAAASAAAQSAAEAMVRGLANGVSYIALDEWTMQGAIESAIDMLRDRMDPHMTDLDQAIPQWVFQRAKASCLAPPPPKSASPAGPKR